MGTLLFADSFDHYSDETQKWDIAPGGTIDLSGTASRTGIGCTILGGTDGPIKYIDPALTRVVFGGAFYPDGPGQNPRSQIMKLDEINTAGVQVAISALPTMAIVVFSGVTYLGQSAAGVLLPNAYNYIELDAEISHDATVVINVNGFTVLTLTHVNTIDPGTSAVTNAFQLKGFGLAASSRWDDVYLLDPTPLSAVGSQFLGPVKIYASVPTANSTPLQWTPVTGTNFENVDEIPPDTITYNSADTVGLADQYLYPATGVPLGSSILGLQHVMNLALAAAGSRAVSSDFEGTIGPELVLTPTYHMLSAPYSTVPGGSSPWTLADFPVKFGPKVTG